MAGSIPPTACAQPGVEIRAGAHTGEVEVRGDVAALASSGEVLTSRTVKDLVAGSGIAGSGISFTARGTHELKGVPGQWELHAAS